MQRHALPCPLHSDERHFKHVSAGFVDSSTEKSVPGVGAGNDDWVHVKCG